MARTPIYAGYFADPFVWKHEGVWYAVGTGDAEHRDRVFMILRSRDFLKWEPAGFAMHKLPADYGDAYWAPEVAYAEGRFWLYYSVGRGDKAHHIRVATSASPEGPYTDSGTRVTDPFQIPFAIDASPFRDDDGQWYLYYARDFLDSSPQARAGTGVVVDRLVGMTRLAGEPRVVMRARHDWQRFLKDRIMYGGVYDWHTIEGPNVRKRNGRYWCLFSAGRWENESYGVDFVVAENPLGPFRDETSAAGARLLHTVKGQLIGPGHNSLAVGPDGEDYIVYHAWDARMTARRTFIDRLVWTDAGPRLAE